jgi:hypothetical protein
MMWTRGLNIASLATLAFLVGCSGSGTKTETDGGVPDSLSPPDVLSETAEQETVIFVDTVTKETFEDSFEFDVDVSVDTTDPLPECEAGEGCFLDPCSDNSQCQSGWCVEHLGQKVCTQTCQEECPAGWTCQQVGADGPDVMFICIPNFPNLCRPCTAAADCEGTAGTEDACVQYGEEGSFCGGKCGAEGGCPVGFSCETVTTVNGVELEQCVSATGLCPCTDTSVELGLFTYCELSNEYGTCQGKRVCTADGLTECDALEPGLEVCNGLDDNCNGDVDEGDIVEGTGVCEDGNECTKDTCLGVAGCENVNLSEGECKDGDPCTVADHCDGGECIGNPVICDDGNPCTDDSCDGGGGCVFEDNSAACDDGDPCTIDDVCSGGSCDGTGVPCECQTTADCGVLEDGDMCNGTLFCNLDEWPYKCEVAPETVVTCDDPAVGPNAVCQQAFCDPSTGSCSIIADHEGSACEDGNACTIGDKCVAGTCTPGVPNVCEDNNLCTDDSCDVALGCVFTNNVLGCEDGSVCTVGDVCVEGVCQSGELVVCNDENPCTDDSCDPVEGCLFVANDGACDDGIECTLGDHCAASECVYDELASCDDGNPCTDNSCDPATGCVTAMNDALCDDEDVCTVGDHCVNGECVHDEEVQCNDFNVCTDDVCDPDNGCTFSLNQGPCDDFDACTVGEHCAAGVCMDGDPVDCDDGDECTVDSCDNVVGCEYKNICVGSYTLAIVPGALTAHESETGTLTLTVGQPVAGALEDEAMSAYFGFCPIAAVE